MYKPDLALNNQQEFIFTVDNISDILEMLIV